MNNEKMVMGSPPDDNEPRGKKPVLLSALIVLFLMVLIYFLFFKVENTKLETVKKSNKSAELVNDNKELISDTTKTLDNNENKTKVEQSTLPTDNHVHEVKEGESLWLIASSSSVYKDGYMWYKLYEANKSIINDPDVIYIGQKLIIP